MCVAKLTEFMLYCYASFKHLGFQNTLERKTCFLLQSETGAILNWISKGTNLVSEINKGI